MLRSIDGRGHARPRADDLALLAVLAVVGAIPVIATTVGARSPGALDNATGVATVLAAVEDARELAVSACA